MVSVESSKAGTLGPQQYIHPHVVRRCLRQTQKPKRWGRSRSLQEENRDLLLDDKRRIWAGSPPYTPEVHVKK